MSNYAWDKPIDELIYDWSVSPLGREAGIPFSSWIKDPVECDQELRHAAGLGDEPEMSPAEMRAESEWHGA